MFRMRTMQPAWKRISLACWIHVYEGIRRATTG